LLLPACTSEGWEGGRDAHAITGGVSYYLSVDAHSAQALRASLHALIRDHHRYPYSGGSIDTWTILEAADQDPADPSGILDVYKNAHYAKVSMHRPYNREHTWPRSYGFPESVPTNIPMTDCHALFLADSAYNSARNNKPYRNCTHGCKEEPTVGGGGSNYTAGHFVHGSWQTWPGRWGDVARALFYLDVRYEGGVHQPTGSTEPDLILTDDESKISASETGHNLNVAYMGMLSDLLAWNDEDPVDAKEQERNEVVFSYQGNRNPFIDHPEWVACLFKNHCQN
jgi:endonuclease I